MPERDYRQQFLELVEALQANDRISLDNYVLGGPLPAAEMAKLEKEHKAKLPGAARDFYAQMDGFVLEWRLSEGLRLEYLKPKSRDELWGSVHIPDLATMLGGPEDTPGWRDILWFDHLDAETKAERQELRPFDMYDDNDAQAACFRLRRGRLEDKLVLHSIDDGIMPLDIGVAAYLDLLLQSSGLIGWQEAYAYPGGIERERFLHYMPQLFPKADLAAFRS